MRGRITCAVWAGLLAGAGLAQRPDAALVARLDTVASLFTADNAFMGSVLVARGDQVLLKKGFGKADLEWGIANTPDVKFRLGSLTNCIRMDRMCPARSVDRFHRT